MIKKKSRENDGTEREREAIVLSIRKRSLSLELFVKMDVAIGSK